MILLGLYFPNERKALAYAIATSGMGSGAFLIPFVYTGLRQHYTLKDTMVLFHSVPVFALSSFAICHVLFLSDFTPSSIFQLLFGGISFNVAALGIACVEPKCVRKNKNQLHVKSKEMMCPQRAKEQWREDSPSQHQQNSSNRRLFLINSAVFSDSRIVLLLIMYAILFLSFTIHYTFCGALVQQNGLTEVEVARLISINGLSSLTGSLTSGLIFDLKFVKTRRTMCYFTTNVLYSMTILSMPFLKHFYLLCVPFTLWGLLSGFLNTTGNVVMSDYVSPELLPDAVGAGLFFMAIGTGLGPTAGGK